MKTHTSTAFEDESTVCDFKQHRRCKYVVWAAIFAAAQSVICDSKGVDLHLNQYLTVSTTAAHT